MRCGKWISFAGSTAALAAMTVGGGHQKNLPPAAPADCPEPPFMPTSP
jgi:hypothetical protein